MRPEGTAFEAPFPPLVPPLVPPEVITGLAPPLLFVVLQRLTGWPEGHGAGTVTTAHASLSIAYVAVVVRARLADAGTALDSSQRKTSPPADFAFLAIAGNVSRCHFSMASGSRW